MAEIIDLAEAATERAYGEMADMVNELGQEFFDTIEGLAGERDGFTFQTVMLAAASHIAVNAAGAFAEATDQPYEKACETFIEGLRRDMEDFAKDTEDAQPM